MKEYILGIDLGGTNVDIGIVRISGEIIASRTISTDAESGPHNCVKKVADTVSELLAEHRVSSDSLLGVGIGAPGPLDLAQGTMTLQIYRVLGGALR